jgi:pyridoxamine 5'-phosphate oxidase family protein
MVAFAHDYRTLIVNLFICKRIRSKVAVIIDDLKTVDPWDHSGVRIYGTADIVTRQREYMDRTGHSNHKYIRTTPYKKWRWGIEEPIFVEGKFNVKIAKKRLSNICHHTDLSPI